VKRGEERDQKYESAPRREGEGGPRARGRLGGWMHSIIEPIVLSQRCALGALIRKSDLLKSYGHGERVPGKQWEKEKALGW